MADTRSNLQHCLRALRGWVPQFAALPAVAVAITALLYWQGGASQSRSPGPASTVSTPTPTASPAFTIASGEATITSLPAAIHGATPTARPTDTPTPTPTARPTDTPTPTPTATPLLPTPDGVPRTARVPILMYHRIGDPPQGADALRRGLSVRPAAFAEQLRWLKEEGYQSITLNDLALHLTVGHPLPERPVILTFDDGYRDAYTHAFPLLKQYGFVGTFFLVTARLDHNDPDWLSWDQVVEMHQAGMVFEPHSYDHPDMRGRSYEFLVFQILASKQAIEARTGETCRFFAYPSGAYDSSVIQVLRSAHFWGGVLTEQGATHTTDGLFTLRRVRIQPSDSLAAFAYKVELDW